MRTNEGQSVKASLVECLVRKLATYIASIFLQIYIYHDRGFNIGFAESAEIAFYFSTASFVVGFGIRRWFNWLNETGYLK